MPQKYTRKPTLSRQNEASKTKQSRIGRDCTSKRMKRVLPVIRMLLTTPAAHTYDQKTANSYKLRTLSTQQRQRRILKKTRLVRRHCQNRSTVATNETTLESEAGTKLINFVLLANLTAEAES